MAERRKISDTVSVTANGTTIVDVQKLFAKEHIKDTIRQIRKKTRIVTRRTALEYGPSIGR